VPDFYVLDDLNGYKEIPEADSPDCFVTCSSFRLLAMTNRQETVSYLYD